MDDDRRAYLREYMQGRRAAERSARPLRACLECSAEFEIKQGNKRYCSDSCTREARLRRRRTREYTPAPLKCGRCDGDVPYKSGKRRYCSDECYKAVAKERWDRYAVKGISAEDHAESCALCGSTERALVIDHDHKCCPTQRSCGQCVRGFLCRSCNGALGMFNDDPALLRKAAEYVQRSRTHPKELSQ